LEGATGCRANQAMTHFMPGCLQVTFAADYKTVKVTTTADAPGGARTERVALPYDPDLYHHMVTHDVKVVVNPSLTPNGVVCWQIHQMAQVLVAHFHFRRQDVPRPGWLQAVSRLREGSWCRGPQRIGETAIA
jgi:hypothetical protein